MSVVCTVLKSIQWESYEILKHKSNFGTNNYLFSGVNSHTNTYDLIRNNSHMKACVSKRVLKIRISSMVNEVVVDFLISCAGGKR